MECAFHFERPCPIHIECIHVYALETTTTVPIVSSSRSSIRQTVARPTRWRRLKKRLQWQITKRSFFDSNTEELTKNVDKIRLLPSTYLCIGIVLLPLIQEKRKKCKSGNTSVWLLLILLTYTKKNKKECVVSVVAYYYLREIWLNKM